LTQFSNQEAAGSPDRKSGRAEKFDDPLPNDESTKPFDFARNPEDIRAEADRKRQVSIVLK